MGKRTTMGDALRRLADRLDSGELDAEMLVQHGIIESGDYAVTDYIYSGRICLIMAISPKGMWPKVMNVNQVKECADYLAPRLTWTPAG